MKKNLFLFQHYASHGRMPGRTRHFHMAKAISDEYDTYIFSSGYLHDQKRYITPYGRFQCYSREEVDGIVFVWVKTFPYIKNNWRRFVNIVDYSMKAILAQLFVSVRPDIVVASVAHHFSLLTGFVVSRLYKTPYIIDIGDLWPDALAALGYLNPLSVRYRLMKRFTYPFYRSADCVMCLSEDAESRLVEIGVDRRNIHIVYPYKEISGNEIEYERDGNIFTVLYAGSFNSVYPLGLILDVAEELLKREAVNIKFILIGFGHQRDELIRKSKDLPNVVIMEPVPQEQLFRGYFRKADLFLVAEKNVLFGFPNKLSEYMLYGKPVLVVSPIKYLSGQQRGGIFYVDELVREDIEAQIVKIYEMFTHDFEEYYERGLSNKLIAQKLFSRESVRAAVISCFESARSRRA